MLNDDGAGILVARLVRLPWVGVGGADSGMVMGLGMLVGVWGGGVMQQTAQDGDGVSRWPQQVNCRLWCSCYLFV